MDRHLTGTGLRYIVVPFREGRVRGLADLRGAMGVLRQRKVRPAGVWVSGEEAGWPDELYGVPVTVRADVAPGTVVVYGPGG